MMIKIFYSESLLYVEFSFFFFFRPYEIETGNFGFDRSGTCSIYDDETRHCNDRGREK